MPIRIIEEASVPDERGGKVRIIERAASPQATPDQMRAFAGRGRKPVSGPMDMLKGGVSGLYGSLASMAPPVFADGPLRAVRQAASKAAHHARDFLSVLTATESADDLGRTFSADSRSHYVDGALKRGAGDNNSREH